MVVRENCIHRTNLPHPALGLQRIPSDFAVSALPRQIPTARTSGSWPGLWLTYRSTRRGPPQPYCRIEIVCKKIHSDLLALGVYPNKTHTVQPCERVPAHLARHYWRGLVDGDGCIHLGDRKGGARYISLCGSEGIVTGFRDYCGTLIDVSRAKVVKLTGMFRVSFGGLVPTQKICMALYGDSTVFLERKKTLAEGIVRETGQKKHYQYLTAAEIQHGLDQHGSLEEMAHAKSWLLAGLKRQAKKLGFKIADGRTTKGSRMAFIRARRQARSGPEQLTLFGGLHVR